jgi:ribosomal protein S11
MIKYPCSCFAKSLRQMRFYNRDVLEKPKRATKATNTNLRWHKPHRKNTANAVEQNVSSVQEFCCITIKKTKNNIYCNISHLFGHQKTLWSVSGGQVKASHSNGRRKTRFVQRMIFKNAVEKLLGLGFKYLVIHCSGPALSKRYVFKNFYKRFKIVMLKDFTSIAHNGCRASSVRRV